MRRRILASLGHKLTARDYVQDGLIAMWDGIENAGWGVHTEDAVPIWKNLCGVGDAKAQNGWVGFFGEKFVVFDSNIKHYFRIQSDLSKPSNITLECCFNAEGRASWSSVFSCMESGGFAISSTGSDMDFWFQCASPSGGYYTPVYTYVDSRKKDVTLTASVGQSIDVYKNGDIDYAYHIPASGVRYNYNYFQIGKDVGDDGYLNGKIYNIRLYNRVLTPVEIAANYAIDKARFNLT